MTNISTFKRLSFAAALAISALGSVSMTNSAFANGTHPTGDGGRHFLVRVRSPLNRRFALSAG
ncbi:hypothetical protein [Mesorhizobium erdmanii]|uniref:hypothetical protein n=1 Tax=Mesorhizobium erdmanii TaxID=1777866 RepID=UPI0004187186|nr:hypothetical protein [Mesorhizobium erdmanii]